MKAERKYAEIAYKHELITKTLKIIENELLDGHYKIKQIHERLIVSLYCSSTKRLNIIFRQELEMNLEQYIYDRIIATYVHDYQNKKYKNIDETYGYTCGYLKRKIENIYGKPIKDISESELQQPIYFNAEEAATQYCDVIEIINNINARKIFPANIKIVRQHIVINYTQEHLSEMMMFLLSKPTYMLPRRFFELYELNKDENRESAILFLLLLEYCNENHSNFEKLLNTNSFEFSEVSLNRMNEVWEWYDFVHPIKTENCIYVFIKKEFFDVILEEHKDSYIKKAIRNLHTIWLDNLWMNVDAYRELYNLNEKGLSKIESEFLKKFIDADKIHQYFKDIDTLVDVMSGEVSDTQAINTLFSLCRKGFIKYRI